jgi:hypothetical protein
VKNGPRGVKACEISTSREKPADAYYKGTDTSRRGQGPKRSSIRAASTRLVHKNSDARWTEEQTSIGEARLKSWHFVRQ